MTYWVDLQGATIDLPPLKNFHPPKMTQNDMKCYFESFLGGEIFLKGGGKSIAAPCNANLVTFNQIPD